MTMSCWVIGKLTFGRKKVSMEFSLVGSVCPVAAEPTVKEAALSNPLPSLLPERRTVVRNDKLDCYCCTWDTYCLLCVVVDL